MSHTHLALLDNQAFSLMGRMHVILRRQTGRITDIEYMRIDPQYCRHVLELAFAQPNDDLKQLCERLQEIYFGPQGLFVAEPPKPPLMARLAGAPASSAAAEPAPVIAAPSPAPAGHGAEVDKTYIGRLR